MNVPVGSMGCPGRFRRSKGKGSYRGSSKGLRESLSVSGGLERFSGFSVAERLSECQGVSKRFGRFQGCSCQHC